MLGKMSTALAGFFVCVGLVCTPATALAAKGKAKAKAKPAEVVKPIEPTPMIASMADWAVRSGDNQDLPFAIIDKTAATVFVFTADGEFIKAGPALLGLANGDRSTPGTGDRELSDIMPEDRTTPAGRFIGGYGPALGKSEDVLWVDYGTAISLHEVVTTNPKEKRLQRLKSKTVDDNRITFGCINVSKSFYREVVKPTFKGTRSVFYILPEEKALAEVFPSFDRELAMTSRGPISPALSGPHRPSALW